MSPCARTVTRRRNPARVTYHVIRSSLTPDQPYSTLKCPIKGARTGSKLLRMESSAFTVRAASPVPRKHRTTTATRRRLRTHRNGRRCRDSATNSTNRSALDGSSCYSVTAERANWVRMGLTFEHDGSRLFSLKDVDRITSIGNTVQMADPTRIGKFGIGFKAVYAYTCTPEIRSGPYRFHILDMVVPQAIECDAEESADHHYPTIFRFPFDNREKPPNSALGEIKDSLRELDDATLLFLKNIPKIVYRLPDSTTGSMERVRWCDDPNRISIVVDQDSGRALHHYLRFDREVDVTDEDGKSSTCRISAAFGLKRSADGDWRIVPLSPGRVCIYFPAVKETSNLRFHVHAPFASTVARDSVRECESNYELRDHLAKLIAESMMDVRDRGHLTAAFLAVLPNESDSVSDYYRPIMTRLIDAFTAQPLLPMKRGSHAAASGVYRADRRGLSDSDRGPRLGVPSRGGS